MPDHDALLVVFDWSRLLRHADDEAFITALVPGDDRIVSVKVGNDLADAAKAGMHVHAQRSGEKISQRTRDATTRKKAEGTTFGNPDILNVQRLGADAISAKSDALETTIADVIRQIPDQETLSSAELADVLNTSDRTGASSSWDVSRVTGPLRKARTLLSVERIVEAEAAARAHPNFGRF